MIVVNIGKCKLRVHAEGCVDCGTLWAYGWHEADTISVTAYNRKPFIVVIHRCDSCQRKLQRKK